jgi:hypothetical protein
MKGKKKKPKTTHKLNLPPNILNLQAIIAFNFQNKNYTKMKNNLRSNRVKQQNYLKTDNQILKCSP